ncbi:hypothetical protein BC830DRAFT_1170432 [Chytriomyces sp. MP71]|nr:hypothetical protein BC830DRAFT_1170432 [Chytriomyces sp. MP71]
MSAATLSRLFPDLTATARVLRPALWTHLFPSEQQDACPPVTVALQHVPGLHQLALAVFPETDPNQPIRYPVLLFIALFGLAVGIVGFALIPPKLWTWRRAFLLFAGMNLAGISCHCLAPLNSRQMSFGWAADVACTGSSSFYLILATLYHPRPLSWTPENDAQHTSIPPDQKSLALQAHLLTAILFSFSHIGLSNSHQGFRIPFTSEIVYLAITALAGAVMTLKLVAPSWTKSETEMGISSIGFLALNAAACSVAISLVLAVPIEQTMCSSRLNTEVSASILSVKEVGILHIFFLGCTLAFLSLLCYIRIGGYGCERKTKKE